MQIVCAWCKRTISNDGPDDPDVVSHGICPRCFEEEEKKLMALDPYASPHHVDIGGEG